MNSLKGSLARVSILFAFLMAIVHGCSGTTGPSPPRNLRRRVLGTVINTRKHQVYWTASQDTGGSAVNYSLKLCINDSVDADNHSCKWSRNSQCHPRNIPSSSEELSCMLDKKDFFSPSFGQFSNYTICVVASNEAGSATSCIFSPMVESGLGTPFPPTGFSVLLQNGDVRVQWKLNDYVQQYFEKAFTFIYHAENKPNKTKHVKGGKVTFTIIGKLEAYTKHCFYMKFRTFTSEGKRSHPSDVIGPRCIKTPAADPINPPVVQLSKSVPFPEDETLRNVTVEWKPAKQFSWKGTPGQYHIYLWNRLLSRRHSNGAVEYRVNASSNRTVLQRLKSGDSYYLNMKLSNVEGKFSARGDPFIIKALPDNSDQPGAHGGLTSKQKGAIGGVVGLSCLAAVVIVCCFRKCRRERPDLQPLDKRVQVEYPHDLAEYEMPEVAEQKYSSLYAHVSDDTYSEANEQETPISRDSWNGIELSRNQAA